MLKVINGYSNWKDATVGFRNHELSGCHREAVEVIISLPATTMNIGAHLSRQYAQEKELNRKMLIKILSCIQFLARQGLPLRGHGDDSDGNLLQLLKYQGDDEIEDWLQRKTNKYTSHEMQNSFLKIMALDVLRNVIEKLQKSPYLTIMIDETTDVTNQEQVTIVLRRIDDTFETCEEFIGLYTVSSIEAACLTEVIKDTMIRLNLSMEKLRGQCYDGCSTMSGIRTGVAKRISDEEPRAVFTHCYGHSLNVACSDTVKKSKLLKQALETTQEITKLIKFSPRRDAIFKKLKSDNESMFESKTMGIRVLCPTRWTVRADSLFSIIENYTVLHNTWDEALEISRDTETKARILGVQSQMVKFDFLFGVVLGEMILRHTDNLSRALQAKVISAAEGQQTANMVVQTLQKLRQNREYDLFWMKVSKMSESLEVEDAQVPRKRRLPKRYDDGLAEAEFHNDPKSYYRQHYFEAIDLAINCIQGRFQQPGYQIYSNLEQLLLKASQGQDYASEFEHTCSFYKDDFDSDMLHAQLQVFTSECQRQQKDTGIPFTTVFDIKDFFCTLTDSQKSLLSEVCKVVKLILIMPASNATSERSFSALRRVKSYLRSTMCQQRLNNLMVLHVYKDITDTIDLQKIATEFIGDSEHRLKIFGKHD